MSGENILIKHGRVIDPAHNRDEIADVLVLNGKIDRLDNKITDSGNTGITIIDAQGCVVAPGFIDCHVHVREPGREDEETIATGSRAAAHGGFTTIVAMPNTTPAADTDAVIEFIIKEAARVGLVNVYPAGALTKARQGVEIAELGKMKAAGAIAFTDDGSSVMNSLVMRRVMEYAAMLAMPILVHSEDQVLGDNGSMHEGYYSTLYGMKGIPAEAETIMVSRDIQLAALTGVKLHIMHVSTQGAVALIREAKKKGLPVTAEVTPHHISLIDECLKTYDTNYKMSPPLRSAADAAALKEGLADGTIDIIATDHAPHALFEKEVEFDHAPFGVIGLETAVSIILNELYHRQKVLTLPQIVRAFSTNPARMLGLSAKGSLAPGADADITIFDPEKKVTIDAALFVSKSRNTPFNHWQLTGAPFATIVAGRCVWKAL